MLSEYDRASLSDEELEKKYFKNKVDKTRTHLNYALIDDTQARLQARLDEVYHLKRSDVVESFSLITTLPQGEYTQDEQREFFEQTLKFLQQRYGEKNVIGAYVHNDETTPHMHCVIVPIVECDMTKKGVHYDEKLCCKEVLTPQEFKTFHSDYQDYLDQYCASEFKVISDALKLEQEESTSTSLDELQSTQRKSNYEKLQQENTKLKKAYIQAKEEYKDLQSMNFHIQQQAYQKEQEYQQEIKALYQEKEEYKSKYKKEYEENHKFDKYMAKENEWANDWDLRK